MDNFDKAMVFLVFVLFLVGICAIGLIVYHAVVHENSVSHLCSDLSNGFLLVDIDGDGTTFRMTEDEYMYYCVEMG
jgi:hypothetical protein